MGRPPISPKAWLTLCGLVCACGASLSRAALIVSPASAVSTEGNSDNIFPFDIAGLSLPTQRYQQIYSAGDFSSLTESRYITDIAFRPDAAHGAAFSTILPEIRINLSTTPAAVDQLNFSFADNCGADDTVVYAGALTISSNFTGPAGGPKNFDISIHLSTPFLYDPANGNLLLDINNFQGGSAIRFDAVDDSRDTVSRSYTNTPFSGVSSATTDVRDTMGLVTQFTTAVPEPGMGTFATVTFVILSLRRNRGGPGRQLRS